MSKAGWYQLVWNGVSEWYYFNANGDLISGWFMDVDGNKYYLHTLHDGNFGRMYTGWNIVDGKWQFFNDDPAAGKIGVWMEGKEVPAELVNPHI
ncbi:MAG: hypothetical protein ACI4HI_03420 [Lachnospiraceae bacterium]